MNRISSFQPHDNMQYHLRRREWMMNDTANKLASQQRIRNLRDDPTGAGRAVRFDSLVTRMKRYSKNADTVASHLNFAEGYLTEAVDIMQRINEIAVQGANGIYDTRQLGYMAQEVDALLGELVAIGNARSEEGGSLFAGHQVNSDAFQISYGPLPGDEKEGISNVEYIGNIGMNPVEISEEAYVSYHLPGNHVFWAENQQIYSEREATEYRVQEDAQIRIDGVPIDLKAGDGIHAVVSKINDSAAPVRARLDPVRNSLVIETTTPHQIWPEDLGGGTVLQDLGVIGAGETSPPQNIADSARAFGGSVFDMVIFLRDRLLEGNSEEVGGAALKGIQDSIQSLASSLADVGAQHRRIEVTGNRLIYEIPEVEGMLSQEKDIDMTAAITNLKMLEYTHSAALATMARILRPSLLDFLR